MYTHASKHITLIGMPTAGKTKVGRKLAKHLDCRFVDIDEYIVKKFGARSLQEIVDSMSAQDFAKLEEDAAVEVLRHLRERTVIATGGSMVYYDRAMDALQRKTKVIHLHATFETIARRIARKPDRGIVFAPGESLEDLYKRRIPLYERWAHMTVATDHKRSHVALELADLLR